MCPKYNKNCTNTTPYYLLSCYDRKLNLHIINLTAREEMRSLQFTIT